MGNWIRTAVASFIGSSYYFRLFSSSWCWLRSPTARLENFSILSSLTFTASYRCLTYCTTHSTRSNGVNYHWISKTTAWINQRYLISHSSLCCRWRNFFWPSYFGHARFTFLTYLSIWFKIALNYLNLVSPENHITLKFSPYPLSRLKLVAE